MPVGLCIAVIYLCVGSLFVAIVMGAYLGILTEMFPLYIACLIISASYFDPKLVIRFGVIAGEVRNLAQKSEEAAKSTSMLIESSV